MSDEILALSRSQLRRVSEKIVYTMDQQGELPAFNARGQRRFTCQPAIDQRLEERTVASRETDGGLN